MPPISSTEDLVYQRALDTLASVLPTHKQSPWLYDLIEAESSWDFGTNTFQVGFLATEDNLPTGRQRKSSGAQLVSLVGIKVVSKARADGSSADFKTLLANAAAVRRSIIDSADSDTATVAATGPQKWRYQGQVYSTLADGTHVMVTQTYQVWHHLAANTF